MTHSNAFISLEYFENSLQPIFSAIFSRTASIEHGPFQDPAWELALIPYGIHLEKTTFSALKSAAVPPTNVALVANGGVASASSTYAGYPASGANNGGRKGDNANDYWNDAAPANTFPDWLQIDFNGSKTIDEIDVFSIQDNWQNPSEPTEAMTFSQYGLTAFEVQYWNPDTSAWVTVSGGSITGNNKV
jgi:hypothetical protein